MGTREFNAGGGGYHSIVVTHPGGSRKTPSRFMLLKPEISDCLMGHLARMQTLPSTLPGLFSTHPWNYMKSNVDRS